MGGWGRGIINVTPQGRVLPCHAAESIPGLEFDNVQRQAVWRDIWLNGQAFQKYRGTSWMKEPCRSCPRAEIDFGGCRCQAMALTGDAANTDPACSLSPHHAALVEGRRESRVPRRASRRSSTGAPAEPAQARARENSGADRGLAFPDSRRLVLGDVTLQPRGASFCSVAVQKTSWHTPDRHKKMAPVARRIGREQ